MADEYMSELEDRSIEIAQQQKEKINNIIEWSLWDLRCYTKKPNICIIGVSSGKEKGCGAKKIFKEIATKNFLPLVKDIKLTDSRTSKPQSQKKYMPKTS